MLHEPASSSEPDYASAYKASLGVKLFFVYAIIYGGFVAIGLFSIDTYKTIVFWGLNLAIVYGMGLIALALIMALIYNSMCTKKEKELYAKHHGHTPSHEAGQPAEEKPAE